MTFADFGQYKMVPLYITHVGVLLCFTVCCYHSVSIQEHL